MQRHASQTQLQCYAAQGLGSNPKTINPAHQTQLRYSAGNKRKRQEEHQSRKKQVIEAPTLAAEDLTSHLPAQATDSSTDVGGAASVADKLDVEMVQVTQEQSQTETVPQIQALTASIQPAKPDINAGDDALQLVKQEAFQSTKPVTPVSSVEQPPRVDKANGVVVQQAVQSKAKAGFEQHVVARPLNDARGHTGYLTFARRSVDD